MLPAQDVNGTRYCSLSLILVKGGETTILSNLKFVYEKIEPTVREAIGCN